jgi:ABC-type sugar transport system ATPase subunit
VSFRFIRIRNFAQTLGVMISSELPEILGMSDRIAVMHAGSISGILARSEATQQKILKLSLGHKPTGEMARIEE